MKLQAENYDCGSAAIVNACRCYGKAASLARTRKLFSDQKEGTNEFGIAQGLAYWGFPSLAITETKMKLAWEHLMSGIAAGHPSILCVDCDNHWITIIGACGERLVAFDGAKTIKNIEESGIAVYTRRALTKRWKNKEGKFYGLIVLPPVKQL